ncbi:phospholipase A1 [Manduca sexta]|uniref:phospholipase A1 n=1 Tax=Manduca sexta TaxID=7130 RepID=UPI0011825059|nr:phospholipase A1 [Manduca sexta]
MVRRRAVAVLSLAIVIAMSSIIQAGTYAPKSDIGYPAGLIPDCPGVMKNATISTMTMPQLQITIHKLDGQVTRRSVAIESAPRIIAKDKSINFKTKKTVLYAVGFLDSSVFPHSQAIGTAYSKRGYNVFITETIVFLTHIYPKSVRLTRAIGKKLGEFLVSLVDQGLTSDSLELVGASLGAHIVAYAAKYFYEKTGQKISRVTGLDPAGPCFRNMDPQFKLAPTDGLHVDVIHTNIDGFGIAERLGHVDIYVNGGEFQPSDIPYIPCLVICSHIRAILYWWQAVEHPKKFIGMKCDSVQDARFAKCFNNSETNYMGIETNFAKPGIYYLPTNNEFPYYRGKEGLKAENEIYTSVIKRINSDDGFVV